MTVEFLLLITFFAVILFAAIISIGYTIMATQAETLALLEAANTKIDETNASIAGIKADVDALKDQLGAGDVPAAISDAITALSAKIDGVAGSAAALDAETPGV